MKSIQRVLAPSSLFIFAGLLCATLQAHAQSESTPSKNAPVDVRSYVTTQVVPYWLNQKTLLDKTMSSPPAPQYKALWDELDAVEKSKSVRDTLSLAMQAQTPHERNARMIWLRWRIVSGNADSRYSYTYAYLLSTTAEGGSKKPMMAQAAALFFQARIALDIDGARCADQASPQVARRNLEQAPYMAPILNHMATGPKVEIASALTNATALEQMRPDRPRQDWLCGLGAGTMAKALDNEAAVKMDGNAVTIDTKSVTPDYIPDDLWHQRKQAILDDQLKAIGGYLR